MADFDIRDAVVGAVGAVGGLGVAVAGLPVGNPAGENERVARRLRRAGMEDVDITKMVGEDTAVIEWRIPGETPPDQMNALTSMRQLRSVMRMLEPGEVSSFEFRYPTITWPDVETATFESRELEDEVRERYYSVLRQSGLDVNGRATPALKGGGRINTVGYTPHYFSASGQEWPADEVIDLLLESVENYRAEFRGNIL
jgi:hypothetical protein